MRPPTVDVDVYSRRSIDDPLPVLAAVRDAGPVVWLPRNRLWAIGRYADVRAALLAPDVFVSGAGIAANRVANRLGRRTVVASDGTVHAARRRVLQGPLSPRSLAAVEQTLRSRAEQLVADVRRDGEVDGVRDIAAVLPVEVVADWVGLTVDRHRLLRWGRRTFDSLGPLNRLALRAVPAGLGLQLFARSLTRSRVRPGGWAAHTLLAAQRHDITPAEARAMVVDLVTPSLDTTILATAELIWQLGTRPDVWDRLRADPTLVPSAVAEAVRLASPIRGFTRWVPDGATVDGVHVPPRSRVLVLFAAANRDPARFAEPDTFIVSRPPGDQLGWGHGRHACVGMHLAKLEMQALLTALLDQVRTIAVRRPVRIHNNVLQGYASFRVRLAS